MSDIWHADNENDRHAEEMAEMDEVSDPSDDIDPAEFDLWVFDKTQRLVVVEQTRELYEMMFGNGG